MKHHIIKQYNCIECAMVYDNQFINAPKNLSKCPNCKRKFKLMEIAHTYESVKGDEKIAEKKEKVVEDEISLYRNY